MRFRDFFTERTATALEASEQKQVDKLTRKYISKIQKSTPKKIQKFELLGKGILRKVGATPISGADKPRYEYLGTLNTVNRSTKTDQQIHVYVLFNCNSDASGMYYEDDNEIFLFHENLKFQSEGYIHEILSHETVHAVQHYKKQSQSYVRAVGAKQFGPKRKKAYYSEPIEREATLGGIVAQINKRVDDHLAIIKKEKEQNKSEAVLFYYTRTLESLLKSIELFAKTPPENYLKYKELPLPAPIAHRYEFFQVLSSDPKLRREYQLKMINLSEKLNKKAKEFLNNIGVSFQYIS